MEVGLPYCKKFILGGVYREHQHFKVSQEDYDTDSSTSEKQEERFVKFVNLWSDALEREKEVNVIGDFNINLKENVKMSSLHTRLYDSIQKEIHPKGVLQMVKGVTRQQGSSKSSLLDHIYSTESEKIEIENVPWAGSDHNLVGMKRRNGVIGDKPRIIQKRVFHHFNTADFLKDIAEQNWKEVEDSKELDEAVEMFEKKMVSVLDHNCPVKRVQVRNNYTPWMTA